MQSPKWATSLVGEALAWGEELGLKRPTPELRWRRRSREESSGEHRSPPEVVVVRQGTLRVDAKMVLLHEMAHHLVDEGHTATFWDMAWYLYRRARLPIRYCLKREASYRKGAIAAHRRSREQARG